METLLKTKEKKKSETKKNTEKRIIRRLETCRQKTLTHQLRFLNALRNNGGVITATCKATKIGRRTYYNWCKSNRLLPVVSSENKKLTFEQACKKIIESCKDTVEAMLYKKAIEGSISAQKFWLQKNAKDRGYCDKNYSLSIPCDDGSYMSIKLGMKPCKSLIKKIIKEIVRNNEEVRRFGRRLILNKT